MHLRTSSISNSRGSVALRGALAIGLLAPQSAGAAPPLLGRSTPPSEPAATSCPASPQAVSSIGAGRYSEAARLYEQCARATRDPGLWKKAGMARYSARQYAQTIVALDAVLAVGGDAQAEAILIDARKYAVPVRVAVEVAPGAVAPARLTVVQADAAAEDALELAWPAGTDALEVWLDPGTWRAEISLQDGARLEPRELRAVSGGGGPQEVVFKVEEAQVAPPVTAAPVDVELTLAPAGALTRGATLRWSGAPGVSEETIRTTHTRWQLAPGAWQLEVQAPRFVPQTRALDLRAGPPAQVTLKLRRTPQEKARIALAATTGGVGVGLLVGGLALALRGRRDYRAVADDIDGSASPAARAALTTALPAIRDLSNGTMLATSALGAGVAAVTVAAEGSDTLLTVEAGVGGALLVAGLAWLVPAKRQYADTPAGPSPDLAFLDQRRRSELAAAGLLGLGAGLAAAATLSLITRTVLRGGARPRNRARCPVPRVVGLGLHGSF